MVSSYRKIRKHMSLVQYTPVVEASLIVEYLSVTVVFIMGLVAVVLSVVTLSVVDGA